MKSYNKRTGRYFHKKIKKLRDRKLNAGAYRQVKILKIEDDEIAI